jgi:dolichol-phosphate mannosyltransferase
MKKKLSVIIPCYNEEQVINETYKRVVEVMNGIEYDYELVFINDGSRDKTLQLLKDLVSENPKVKIINFSRNFGHQCAVSAGINNCTGDYAAIIDADLQDPPAVIVDMLRIMEKENANVVYGVRKKREGESFFKKVTARMFYRFLNKMSEVKFPVDTGDFRLIDRKIIENFKSLKENNKYIRGLISWMGYKQCTCYYDREERFAGETKYPLKKMINFALIGIFYFSKKPLQLPLILGIASIFIGILYALFLIVYAFFTPGTEIMLMNLILMSVVLFSGLLLFVIGLLGKYLGNMFDEVKNRPEYIIDEKINF